MEQTDADNDLSKAYGNFWLQRGINLHSLQANNYLHLYDNSIKGVPRVMFKVPTAGGKTFIACNALQVIFDRLPSEQPRVVAWFVPSDAILKQTYRNLSNPQHPYRQKIDSHFNSAVQVVDKEAALQGQGIQPGRIMEQLTIFVLSVQSFAANNKDGRRVFRENSSLAAYAQAFGSGDKIEGADETSLIQAIAHLNPVVIIDESHNFEAKLRVEMFNQINPRFILDLTATPREKSNIISFVDAIKLKRENMVKLPVVVYNRDSTNDVIIDAVQLRRTLEKRATLQENNGGHYIRPIVLFQAQPKSDSDNVTFDKIKQNLIDAGIPEEEIRIKTANNDELKNVDLMSPDCPVRYIITVNALKEGWDCPFAYILASLANKTSKVDVEQILGRILRLPYTTKHNDEFLNLSYVFTSSGNFNETLQNIIRSLNNAGFSGKDYRVADACEATQPEQSQTKTRFGDEQNDPQPAEIETETDIDSEKLKQTLETCDVNAENTDNKANTESAHVTDILEKASQANSNYEDSNKPDSRENDIPNELEDMIKTYTIKDTYNDVASTMKLPAFMKKVNNPSVFEEAGSFVPLTKAMLTDGFVLENADANIDFTRTVQQVVTIDLEERNRNEYVPVHKQLNERQIHEVRELFVGYNIESKRRQLVLKIAKRLHFDEVYEPHISNYIVRVLAGQNDEQLTELFDNDLQTEKAFKIKIDGLVTDYQKKSFQAMLDSGQIKCRPNYSFGGSITLNQKSTGLSKGLYTEEGDMNNLEITVISQIANLDNVLFWHRNPERGKGFCLNGFINHYPDFIVRMANGMIVLIETKGDDRDNSDSRSKIELGTAWANHAGINDYRYFMVFENTKFEGAITVQELLIRLKNIC